MIELPLQRRASARGRNGDFAVRAVGISVYTTSDGEQRVRIELYSQRRGVDPPIWIDLALADRDAIAAALQSER